MAAHGGVGARDPPDVDASGAGVAGGPRNVTCLGVAPRRRSAWGGGEGMGARDGQAARERGPAPAPQTSTRLRVVWHAQGGGARGVEAGPRQAPTLHARLLSPLSFILIPALPRRPRSATVCTRARAPAWRRPWSEWRRGERQSLQRRPPPPRPHAGRPRPPAHAGWPHGGGGRECAARRAGGDRGRGLVLRPVRQWDLRVKCGALAAAGTPTTRTLQHPRPPVALPRRLAPARHRGRPHPRGRPLR